MRNITVLFLGIFLGASVAVAQDYLPRDNGPLDYHDSPRYRDSESHPFRILAYAVHPIGWLAREVIFRPFSYFASSTEATRSVFGYREPFDYREPECFSASDSVTDCRSVMPFNYASVPAPGASELTVGEQAREIYFPDVNYDFDKRALNDLGQGRAHQIADLLSKEPGLRIVLQGHADFKGGDKYNEKLGIDRAEALKAELLKLGVSPDRVSTVTFGKSQPVYSDQTDWARAVNRRVEVHVAEVPPAPKTLSEDSAKGQWREVR